MFKLSILLMFMAFSILGAVFYWQTRQPTLRDNTRLDTYASLLAKKAGTGLTAEEENDKRMTLAERVTTAYEQSNSLSFTADLIGKAPDIHATAEMKMAPEKLEAEIRLDTPGGDTLIVLSLDEGRFQESRWRDDSGGLQIASYVTPSPSGAESIRLRKGIEAYCCLIGSCLQSWVGEKAILPRDFASKIREGKYLGTAIEDGRVCEIVMWEEKTSSSTYVMVFYIDNRGFVVRRDHFRGGERQIPSLFRIQHYENIIPKALSSKNYEPAEPQPNTGEMHITTVSEKTEGQEQKEKEKDDEKRVDLCFGAVHVDNAVRLGSKRKKHDL